MGRQAWTSRLTVEDCPIYLSVTDLRRDGAFYCPSGSTGEASWPLSDGSTLGSLRIEIRDNWSGERTILIPRQALKFGGVACMSDGQSIRLTTTTVHFGGERFWFICECGRRAGKLYLPTGETVFRCRLCYDLTYLSAREHNTQWPFWRTIGEEYRAETERQRGLRAKQGCF
jgi:hypothetical protein